MPHYEMETKFFFYMGVYTKNLSFLYQIDCLQTLGMWSYLRKWLISLDISSNLTLVMCKVS
jgi:hypothetical protein